MPFLKKTVMTFVACGVLSTHASPATLEIVFKDTLWGGAIGSVVGLAAWALDSDNEVDDIPKTMIRGTAIGILAGMAYGFYDAHRMGYVDQTPMPQGLVHYNSNEHQLQIAPAHLLQSAQIRENQVQFSILTTSF